jgi:hypothetical protein
MRLPLRTVLRHGPQAIYDALDDSILDVEDIPEEVFGCRVDPKQRLFAVETLSAGPYTVRSTKPQILVGYAESRP